jgi:hypothetical protein
VHRQRRSLTCRTRRCLRRKTRDEFARSRGMTSYEQSKTGIFRLKTLQDALGGKEFRLYAKQKWHVRATWYSK